MSPNRRIVLNIVAACGRSLCVFGSGLFCVRGDGDLEVERED